MSHSDTKRSMIALLTGIIVTAIVYFLSPKLTIEPKGIFLPTAPVSKQTISPNQVAFYNHLPTSAYQKIGYINVQYHAKDATPHGEEMLAEYVKKLAAANGGRGIVIQLFGHTLSGEVTNAQASYVFRGLAIDTPG